jgi:hypothetical protein
MQIFDESSLLRPSRYEATDMQSNVACNGKIANWKIFIINYAATEDKIYDIGNKTTGII